MPELAPHLRRRVPARRSRSLLAALAAALLAACGPGTDAAAPGGDGEGLVLLPYEGPLAPGVTERDPRLTFHDFGRVPDGQKVKRVFRMRNGDPRPVSITKVDPGCGCTVGSLRAVALDGTVRQGRHISSKEPELLTVEPGEIAELELEIDTAHVQTKNTDKLITVRVVTDSPNGYYMTLEAHILVERPFNVVPETLALGLVPENGGDEGKVEIVTAGHFMHSVGELLEVPDGFEVTLDGEVRMGRPLWTLRARLEPPLALGRITETIRIATTDEEGNPGTPLEVPVTATVVSDLGCDPERIVFIAPRDTAGVGTTEFYSRLAGQRIAVKGVTVDGPHADLLKARVEPVEPSDDGASPRWLVTLETVPPLPAGEEMLRGDLLLDLDDPQHDEHVVPFVVHLR